MNPLHPLRAAALVILSLALPPLLAGCGGDETSTDGEAGAAGAALAGGGGEGLATLVGRVTLDGHPPRLSKLRTRKRTDKCCPDVQVDPQNAAFLMSEERGIENVVVEVSIPGAPNATQVRELVQRNCRFEPRVVVMPAGSTLNLINEDPHPSAIRSKSRVNPPLDVTVPGNDVVPVQIDERERFSVSNDHCPWMMAWVYVGKSGYAAVTDEDGNFRIDGLPTGTYTIELWQERIGRRVTTVELAPGMNRFDQALSLVQEDRAKEDR